MRIEWHDNTSTETRYDTMVLSWTDANSGAEMSVTMSGKKVSQMWDGTTTDLQEFRSEEFLERLMGLKPELEIVIQD